MLPSRYYRASRGLKSGAAVNALAAQQRVARTFAHEVIIFSATPPTVLPLQTRQIDLLRVLGVRDLKLSL